MPVYEYACTVCDTRLEIRQSFTDDALTTCPECGGRLRKLLSAVGVVFKGSGFYRTDSRASAAAAASSEGSANAADAPDAAKVGANTSAADSGSKSSGPAQSAAGSDSRGAKKGGAAAPSAGAGVAKERASKGSSTGSTAS